MDDISQENTYAIDTESALELTRLVEQDYMVTNGMGGVFPEYQELPAKVTRILDAGCGPGGWVLEVARHYPRCEVVGLDVSTLMTQYARARAHTEKRSNTIFIQGNLLQPLEFADGDFDLVNMRFAIGFLLRDAWPSVLSEFFRILRPGGIIRLTEADTIGVTTSPALQTLCDAVHHTAHQMGYGFSSNGESFCMTPMLTPLLTKAGFTHITKYPFVIDSSSGTPLCQNQHDNYVATFTAMLPLFLRTGVMTQLEFDKLLTQMHIEMLQEDFYGLAYLMTATGSKPE